MQIIDLLLPPEPGNPNDIILEVTAGVGGQEAMLFTKELFEMYIAYVCWKGWQCQIVEKQDTPLGNNFPYSFTNLKNLLP